MTPIAFLDAVFFVFSGAALLLVLCKMHADTFPRLGSRWLLVCLLLFTLVYSFCLFVEWSHITAKLDEFEDIIGALLPMWWAFFLYSMAQELSNLDLLKSEQKFKELSDSLPHVVFELDLHGNITYANLQGPVTTGYSFKDVEQGLNVNQLVSPAEKDKLSRNMTRIVTEKVDSHNEYTIVRKDGTTFPASISTRPIIQDGRITGFRGILADITERIRNDELILQSQAEFEAIFNSITDAVVFVDTDRKILRINPAFTEIFGYDFEEVRGKTTRFFYADPDAFDVQGQKRYDVRVVEKQPAYEMDYRKKDGTVFPAETLGVQVKNRDGEIIGFLGIMRDITQRKRDENEKASLESQLRQSHKMEAIGTLTGGIAHDFNNVLAIIIGNAELAKLDIAEGHTTHQHIDQILNASNRAKSLIKRLLTFSRQEKGEKESHYLCRLLEESLETIRSTIPKSIRLDGNIPAKCKESLENCLMITADSTQIHQLLMNLCINAIDAMGEVGTLTIDLNEVTFTDQIPADRTGIKPGCTYEHLTVSDTGHGMEPELVDKIFDPFFTTKDIDKGTGIGLSVVQGIIKNHDGCIFIESEPGEGTTFHIYFPTTTQTKKETQSPKEVQLPRGSEHILFVDDEEMLTMVGKSLLEKLGYTVTIQSKSNEALRLFQNDPSRFDLVITDQAMPNIPGSELARQMLQIRPDIPIILCTGYSSKVDKRKAREIGIREFALKPLDNREIALLVRKVFD